MAAMTMKTKPVDEDREYIAHECEPQIKAQRSAELRSLVMRTETASAGLVALASGSDKHFAAHTRAGAARLLLWSRGGDGRRVCRNAQALTQKFRITNFTE
jgi:hypothetical protein